MARIVLHHGTGATDFELGDEPLTPALIQRTLFNARQILKVRKENAALDLLDAAPFEVFPGTNHFNDEFHVLDAQVSLPLYEQFRAAEATWRGPARVLAEVISEAGGPYVRFVSIQLQLGDPEIWDIFLCHATEDKITIARPIFENLEEAGIRCWFDQAEIAWGESILSKIQEGLTRARFVVVILSSAFLAKNWAQKELRTALTLEIENRPGLVLPLIVGDPTKILASLPFLREKRYLEWTGDPMAVQAQLRRALLRRTSP